MSFIKWLLPASAVSVVISRCTWRPRGRPSGEPAADPICDAYGAGFFFIPGTESCLKVGGLVLTELRGFDPSFSISGTNFYANGTPHPGAGFVPSVSQFSAM